MTSTGQDMIEFRTHREMATTAVNNPGPPTTIICWGGCGKYLYSVDAARHFPCCTACVEQRFLSRS